MKKVTNPDKDYEKFTCIWGKIHVKMVKNPHQDDEELHEDGDK